MVIYHSLAELAALSGPVCVAIGVFDGVHLGHRELIRRTMAEAAGLGGTAVVLTFDPHPVRVLRPENAPRLLTSTEHKLRLIAALGCPALVCLPFDKTFAAKAPEEFIEELATAARDLRMICVGHNWAFGRNRAGNIDLLTALGEQFGFVTLEIEPVSAGDDLVSSTRIRQSVEKGDLKAAADLLGRPYTVLGTVKHGAQLGTRIGFPTANLAAHNEQFPPDGVYAVRAELPAGSFSGVANIGTRPTVNDSRERVLEVHLLDYSDDCYGQDMEVTFVEFLRPEQKFASVELLKEQIARDVSKSQQLESP